MKEEDKYLCPITRQIMVEPVVDALGNTYDKEAIKEWLKDNDKTPDLPGLGSQELPDKNLTPNNSMKKELVEYKEDKINKGLLTFPKLLK